MGLFDRLLNSGSNTGGDNQRKPETPKKEEAFFLDSDAWSSR